MPMDEKIEGPHFEKIYSKGIKGRVFVHRCCVCGIDNAAWGFNVELRRAIKSRKPKFAGQWYCYDHRPQ